LFCNCKIFDEEDFTYDFSRRLRPTQSELGRIDPAANFESMRDRTITYKGGENSSCLVESDDEPPHPLNIEAVRTALIIGLALEAQPVDELHVMRKIVIDGSNTTGFQRTLVIALGGILRVGKREVKIQTISLEEDAARLLSESRNSKEYALDRLGVPLIEVALSPIRGSPKEIQEVALSLGRLMRNTRLVSRGLGTIRQDVNISIYGGEVVEVKGVQKLDLLEKIISFEVNRQLRLIDIRDDLRKRGLSNKDFRDGPRDITDFFKETNNDLFKNEIRKGNCIFVITLKKFVGLLGKESYPKTRFGRELSDIARFYKLGGVIHSDELPGYNITSEEVKKLRFKLKMGELDGFLLLAGKREVLERASETILERISNTFNGVIAETRGPVYDGTTKFIRPRPGSARMYPETDVPPIPLGRELIEELKEEIPRPWDEQISNYIEGYGIPRKLAIQIYDSPYLEIFEELASTTKVPPTYLAATLTDTLINLSRSGLPIEKIGHNILKSLFHNLDRERITKEAISEILESILKGESKDVDDALKKLGLSVIDDKKLTALIKGVLSQNKEIIDSKGIGAFSHLMGKVMIDMRGKADGKKVSRILKDELETLINK
jgi:glutamyl-tRNA(Gln) amidotransferase subunit E